MADEEDKRRQTELQYNKLMLSVGRNLTTDHIDVIALYYNTPASLDLKSAAQLFSHLKEIRRLGPDACQLQEFCKVLSMMRDEVSCNMVKEFLNQHGYRIKSKQQPSGKRKPDRVYPMTSDPRGLCVIINNVDFERNERRDGSDIDAKKLKATFEKLHFEVCSDGLKNLTTSKIKSTVKDFAGRDHSKYNCFVFCILTHGEEDHVFGVDDKSISIEEIRRSFSGFECRTLVGKPKLFVVQACQGDKCTNRLTTQLKSDGPAVSPVQPTMPSESKKVESDGDLPEDTDWIVWISATPGKKSWRSASDGTWFIYDLCNFVNEYAATLSVEKLFLKMNHAVSLRDGRTEHNERASVTYQKKDSMRDSWYLVDKTDG